MDEIELEVFRAGRASRGITPEQLADLASSYDGKNPVPCCIGHPASDKPAHGEIAAFRADGGSLFARIKNLGQAVVDGVKSGEILNRSMAFFSPTHESNPTPGKLAPRHLAFLGAAAPGIPNMPRLDKALAFAADGETIETTGAPAEAVLYEPEPTPVRTVSEKPKEFQAMEKTAEQLAQEAAALETSRTEFAAERKAAYEADNEARVDALIAGGKLLPADRDRTLLVFNALESAPLEFEAGKAKRSPAAELAAILGGAVKLVPVGEGRQSPANQFQAGGDKAADPQAEARRLTARAKELQKADSSLSFEAAIEAAQAEQEG